MTTPEGGVEESLRRGLAEAVGPVEPAADGLERIRARIGGRAPRPWPLAVGADAVGAARHWVWRGHWSWHWSWAWPTALPALTGPTGLALARVSRLPLPRLGRLLPRLRRLARPGELLGLGAARTSGTASAVGVSWLRPVAVLAGVAIIASVSFGVQPFRQAIIQAGNTVLSGGPSQPSGGAGTDGNGAQTGNGAGPPGSGATSEGEHSPTAGADSTSASGTASPHPTTSATCAAAVRTDVTRLPLPSSDPTTTTGAGRATAVGQVKAELLVRSLVPTARPSPSVSRTKSCATPSPSVTPTPSTSGAAPTTSPTPTVGSPSPSPTPTPTTGSPSPTPTPTDSGSPTVSPTDSTGVSAGTDGGTVTGGSTPGSS